MPPYIPRQALKTPKCRTPDGGIAEGVEIFIQGGSEFTPMILWEFDPLAKGYQHTASVWVWGMVAPEGFTALPEIETVVQLGSGATAEDFPVNWKPTSFQDTGLLVNITGIPFDSLGMWARIKGQADTTQIRFRVRFATSSCCGGHTLTYGRLAGKT